MKHLPYFLLLWLPLSAFEPRFTQTYFEFAGKNVERGKVNLQTFTTQTVLVGNFGSSGSLDTSTDIMSTLNNSIWWEFGLTKWLDVTLYGQFIYVDAAERGNTAFFGNSQIFFGFQCCYEDPKTWQPSVRLLWYEEFPTTPYDRLSEGKTYMAGGNGSIQSGGIFVLEKLFFANTFPSSLNLNLIYFYQSRAHLYGPTIFGGDNESDFRTKPSGVYIVNLAFETAFSPEWVVCSDINYEYNGKTTLSGDLGTNFPAQGVPASHTITLTPGIEYNFSDSFGIFGCFWITPWGINTADLFGIIFSASGTF